VTDQLTGLLLESRQLGFLGPGPVEPHIQHALAYAEAVPADPARALDLGAGGGLPGLVLAARGWPSTRWTFLDGQAWRTEFLRRAITELQLEDRVDVVTDRAEEVGRDAAHRGGYDLVVVRSFGPPAVTAECAAPLLADGGLVVVSEGPDTDDAALATRWPLAGLALLSLGQAELVVGGDARAPSHMARIPRTGPVDERYPRRTGIPAKRPLF
jgi:16S rRNA (guanine527-N7)-methyltransferase